MGKIYDFTSKKQLKETQKKDQTVNSKEQYASYRGMIQETIDLLVLTYNDKIEEIKTYKEEMKKVDMTTAKNSKEVLRMVTKLNKMFDTYGIKSNFYRFVALEDTTLLYSNESHTIFVYKGEAKDKAKAYTLDEFIVEFEYYKFTLMLGEVMYGLLDDKIQRLEVTIDTLKSTK